MASGRRPTTVTRFRIDRTLIVTFGNAPDRQRGRFLYSSNALVVSMICHKGLLVRT